MTNTDNKMMKPLEMEATVQSIKIQKSKTLALCTSMHSFGGRPISKRQDWGRLSLSHYIL